jgi:hypothetical protein
MTGGVQESATEGGGFGTDSEERGKWAMARSSLGPKCCPVAFYHFSIFFLFSFLFSFDFWFEKLLQNLCFEFWPTFEFCKSFPLLSEHTGKVLIQEQSKT